MIYVFLIVVGVPAVVGFVITLFAGFSLLTNPLRRESFIIKPVYDCSVNYCVYKKFLPGGYFKKGEVGSKESAENLIKVLQDVSFIK